MHLKAALIPFTGSLSRIWPLPVRAAAGAAIALRACCIRVCCGTRPAEPTHPPTHPPTNAPPQPQSPLPAFAKLPDGIKGPSSSQLDPELQAKLKKLDGVIKMPSGVGAGRGGPGGCADGG
jgi:hypothetical protein